MITTRESINYQFSLIFGYSSPNDVIVGDVIGPGRLTKGKVNELSKEVTMFLMMYNAILRDYTGAELYGIEFELYNFDEKSAQMNIYPQSMIFLPGKYKDCETLLLALKPETGVLDIHKSKESMDKISRLFFEVEEYSERPELSKENKQQVFNKFASRFNKKLYGELIEDKWNKKLIGVTKTLPTEKEMLVTYSKVISNVDVLWYKKPIEINILNPKFQKFKTTFDIQQNIEHLKFSISEPSVKFIVDKTLNLGTNLINLANTGTLDENEDDITIFIINYINEKMRLYSDAYTADWLLSNINSLFIDLKGYFNKFLEYSKEYLSTGEMGDLNELLNKFEYFILNKGKLESENFENIWFIAKGFMEQSITQKNDLRVIDLSSIINYFSEIINKSLNLVRKSFPRYLSYRRLKMLTINLIENQLRQFKNEQEPAKNIGQKLLNKFKAYIFNQIETHQIFFKKDLTFDERELIKEFNSLISDNVESFFDEVDLKIDDLILFTEIQMKINADKIKDHIEKFKKFPKELNYLLSYVLRHSTITRYIKEEPDNEISDPVTFANRFHRFLERRIGGIKLEWKFYILDWIKEYSKRYLKPEEQRLWNLSEVYDDFLAYLEERESNEQNIKNFLYFLDTYIAKLSNTEERRLLLEFYKIYELSININTEFPKYVKNSVKNALNSMQLTLENTIPSNYFNISKDETFYSYIKDNELKYFSKLIPRPITVTLKHILTHEEKESFQGDLYHIIDFKFWHNNAQFELSDNFKEVYREWVRDL